MRILFFITLTIYSVSAFANDVTITYYPHMKQVTCIGGLDDDQCIGGQSQEGKPMIDYWDCYFTADNVTNGTCISMTKSGNTIAKADNNYGFFTIQYYNEFIKLETFDNNLIISLTSVSEDGSIVVGNMENDGRLFPFAWIDGIDWEIYVPEDITNRTGFITVEMTACSADGNRAIGNIVYEDGRRNFIILDKTSGYNEYPSFDFNPAGDNKIIDLKEIGSVEFNELTATAMSQDGNWIAVAATVVNPVDGRTKLTGRYDIRNNELYIATLYPEGDYTFIPVGIDNNGTIVGRMTCHESQDRGQEINHAWVWEKGSDTAISTLSQSFNREISAELEDLDRFNNRPYGITMSEDGDSEYIFGSFTDEKGMKSGYVIEIKGIGTSVDVISNDKDSSALEFYDTSGRRLNLESISDIDGSIYRRHGNKIVILH